MFPQTKRGRKALLITLCFIVGALLFPSAAKLMDFFWPEPLVTKELLRESVGSAVARNEFPTEFELNQEDGNTRDLLIHYTLNQEVQDAITDLIKSYKPDYGSFVAIDSATGRILALTSYTKEQTQYGNLALVATFPAASVFKIITAAAAIDQRKVSAETVIPFNGRSNTLYKRNVNSQDTNRWTRFMTLREAFGRSVNTVFGKLGVFYLGPSLLQSYARRFGFNQKWFTDLPIPAAHTEMDENDPWSIVEAASGFTRRTTMSPLHGALIAAAAANDGVMMEPYIVESVQSTQGEILYRAEKKVAFRSMDPETAAELRTMMRETVTRGTSRGSFRTFLRQSKYDEIEVGGKTGSLTGMNPYGRCDWFVGYADLHGQRIAFAALTVHEKYWTVKSAYLARRFIENYFRPTLEHPETKFVAK